MITSCAHAIAWTSLAPHRHAGAQAIAPHSHVTAFFLGGQLPPILLRVSAHRTAYGVLS